MIDFLKKEINKNAEIKEILKDCSDAFLLSNQSIILTALDEENIQSQIGTYALHLEPAYRNIKRVGNLENSEKLFYNSIIIFLFFYYLFSQYVLLNQTGYNFFFHIDQFLNAD